MQWKNCDFWGRGNGVVWFILVDEAALLAQRAWFNRILFIQPNPASDTARQKPSRRS
jgi:hypothetical protein